MTDAILLAYKDVERSMEQFTLLLQSHVRSEERRVGKECA